MRNTSRGLAAGRQHGHDTPAARRRFTVVEGGLTRAIADKQAEVARTTAALRQRCEELRRLMERLA